MLLFLAGAALIVVFSMTASLVQLIVPDHLRGRVVSIYMVAFRGGMPLGSLAGGYAASLTSAPHVLAVNGALVSRRRALLPGPQPRGAGTVDQVLQGSCEVPDLGLIYRVQSYRRSADRSRTLR